MHSSGILISSLLVLTRDMRRASPANNGRILIIAKQLSQSYQGNGMNCCCAVKFHQNPHIVQY